MTSALLFVTTSPDPSITEERYHDWYDNDHLPARLSVPGISSALRFKSTKDKTWLAYFDMDSVEVAQSKEYSIIKERASENERALMPHVNMDRRMYKLIYSVGNQSVTPPKTLLAVEMTPYPTHEKEFHHWYNTFHIPQMADVAGWSRSRRYELVEPLDKGVCKFLTLHEFDVANALDADKAESTKWRNEVIEIVTQRARNIWEPYHSVHEPAGMHIVYHDGIQFNVKVDGREGAPVIALSNPLGLNLSIWDKVVEALSPDFQIIRYDPRGHGRTSQPTKPTNHPELTGDLIAILDALNVPKLHALVGLSMGGIVALNVALHYPERVRKIITCNCPAFSTAEQKKEWDSGVAIIKERGISSIAEEAVSRWFTTEWKENPGNQSMFKSIQDAFTNTAPNVFVTYSRVVDNYEYVEPAKSLKVPCLLVCGAQDSTLLSMRDLEKAIPNTRLEILDHCGHLPMIEQPESYIEILKMNL